MSYKYTKKKKIFKIVTALGETKNLWKQRYHKKETYFHCGPLGKICQKWKYIYTKKQTLKTLKWISIFKYRKNKHKKYTYPDYTQTLKFSL